LEKPAGREQISRLTSPANTEWTPEQVLEDLTPPHTPCDSPKFLLHSWRHKPTPSLAKQLSKPGSDLRAPFPQSRVTEPGADPKPQRLGPRAAGGESSEEQRGGTAHAQKELRAPFPSIKRSTRFPQVPRKSPPPLGKVRRVPVSWASRVICAPDPALLVYGDLVPPPPRG
jgi:hypothetical protein